MVRQANQGQGGGRDKGPETNFREQKTRCFLAAFLLIVPPVGVIRVPAQPFSC
jgi:hypothetical protein